MDEVKPQWRRRLEQIKGHLQLFGRAIAPRLAHRGPQEIQAIIDQRVMEILHQLARMRGDHVPSDSRDWGPSAEKGT